MDSDSEAEHDLSDPDVRKVNSAVGVSLMVPVQIGQNTIPAVIDTAAQVTVISEEIAENLQLPRQGKVIKCKNAQTDQWMEGVSVPGIKITVGKKTYKVDAVIAPITDPLLLGLDFLKRQGVIVDVKNNHLLIGDEKIPASLKRNDDGSFYHVSRVFLDKRLTVPPNSIKVGYAKLESPTDTTFVIQNTERHKGLLMSSSLVSGKNGELAPVSFINDTNKFITLKPCRLLGLAIEADPRPLTDQESTEDNPLLEPDEE